MRPAALQIQSIDLFEDCHSVEEALCVSLVSDCLEEHPKDPLLNEMPKLEFEVDSNWPKRDLRREVEVVFVV